MILLIDNYDSFTFNLVQSVPDVTMCVVRNDDPSLIDFQSSPTPSSIIISPGPGRPSSTGYVPQVIQHYYRTVPILGVCLGHQAIGELFGGTVDSAPQLMHGKTSQVHHDHSALFKGLPSPFQAARYHSLHLVPHQLPECFRVTAHTDDGCIMGIQHHSAPLFGIQFHPESILTPDGSLLLYNFLNDCRPI